MQYIKGIESCNCPDRSAVTLGKFDGLHRGHQKLVEKVKECAEKQGLKSIVCSFDMLPLYERMHKPGQVLMTKEERRSHLSGKVDYLIDCPFTERFSQIEAEAFIKDILAETFHASVVVVGADFRFGHEKKGDIHMLAAYQKAYGYQLIVIEKERYQGREISSTYVKEALKEGKMELAETLLGYPYSITGVVEHGQKLGRTLGFPTCNVAPPKEKLLPPRGVYLELLKLEGAIYPAIGNLGVKPTVDEEGRVLVESYLLGYSGDAYGKTVEIQFKEFRRPEQKFADVQEMKAQVDKDIAYGKTFFKGELGKMGRK